MTPRDTDELTVQDVRNLFSYEDGHLYWRKKTNNFMRLDRPAGSSAGRSDSYKIIRINKRGYLAHRLIWLHVHGFWPSEYIDHIDGDKTNNRVENLREATRAENMRNKMRYANNTSGLKGVHWYRAGNKWRATIKAGGKQKYLGSFDCKAAAYLAYVVASNEAHGEFARFE
jgi:hypothetical protein